MRGAGPALHSGSAIIRTQKWKKMLHTTMSMIPETELGIPRRPSLRFDGRVEAAPLETR